MNYTKGPWIWFTNKKTKIVELAKKDRGRLIVMSFRRWGMQSAKVLFRNQDECLLEDAEDLCKFNHNDDAFEIDHPDARLIAAAPDLYEACKRYLDTNSFADNEEWEQECSEANEAIKKAVAKAEGERKND